MKKLIIILTYLLLTVIFLTSCKNSGQQDTPHQGEISREAAIDFTLVDLDGVKRTLSEQTGKVVLVDFWTTWCPPCKVEIPHLKELYSLYSDEGLVVWGVGIENKTSLKLFAEEYGIEYPILVDDTKIVASKYNVQSIPTTILFDKKNRIAYRHVGFRPGMEKELKTEIELLLKE